MVPSLHADTWDCTYLTNVGSSVATATQRACGNRHHATRGGLQSPCKRDSFWELDRWGGGVACRERHPPLPRDTPQPPSRQRRGQCVRPALATSSPPAGPRYRRFPALPPGRAPLRRGGGRADLLRQHQPVLLRLRRPRGHHQAVGAERPATACPRRGGWRSWVWARRLGS
jgi:hypothetical protein